MKPYRNNKTYQARAGGGQFRRWDLDRDFGVRECPWCHHLSAHRPEGVTDAHGFIDPAEFTRRVCQRCGWDSARGSVGYSDMLAAYARHRQAGTELALATQDGDAEAIEILEHQFNREAAIASEMMWLRGDA